MKDFSKRNIQNSNTHYPRNLFFFILKPKALDDYHELQLPCTYMYPVFKLDRGCPNGTNTPRGDNFSRHILDSWGVCM